MVMCIIYMENNLITVVLNKRVSCLAVPSSAEPTGVPEEGVGSLSLSKPPGVRQQPLLFLTPLHPPETGIGRQWQPCPQTQ